MIIVNRKSIFLGNCVEEGPIWLNRSFQQTVVGSYPQPDWPDRPGHASKPIFVPRTRLKGQFWRIPEEHLEQAQDDATLLAISRYGAARGESISITDGEIRRESYSNRFRHPRLEGVDIDNPGHR